MTPFVDPFAYTPVPPSRADRYAELARTLALAVNRHRLACVSARLEPEPHDVALWSLLDSLCLPGDDGAGIGAQTLAEAVCGGIWAETTDGDGRG